MRKTKIIATFGPATGDPAIAERALKAGVNVVRLNFSHGDHAEHLETAGMVRKLAEEINRPVAILVDLQGPKIRIGDLIEEPLELQPGKRFTITTRPLAGTAERVSTDYEHFHEEVRPGDPILIDDGKIRLEAVEIKNEDVITVIIDGGELRSRKAVNLPGTTVSLPSLTQKDHEDLRFALEHIEPEYIALSFVRHGKDVRELKGLLKDMESRAGLIAKIEKPEAVKNVDEILAALDWGDGIMVARGDLGVEMSFERIPRIQKELLARANSHGLIGITATQMLESMMNEPMPSRAEATDIFNAIIDGSDAVMLSGETAAGRYPVNAVKAMASIIEEAEQYRAQPRDESIEPAFCDSTFTLATTKAARTAAEAAGAKGVAALTRSGRTALLMSKLALPPRIPFYALTFDSFTLRKMALYYGVQPTRLERELSADDKDSMWSEVDDALVRTKHLKHGDTIVIASGYNTAQGATNVCKIVKLGNREYY